MKKNVCAYARVSTNAKAQEHSFEFQKAYWTETLSSSEEFNFVGMYADKGISGKTSLRRPQFMKMITAAKNKQIDIIFCKSVQRFARNTSELLDYVRQLRDVGVAVIFEKEHINTLESDSDMYLTVAAAIAEDDLSRYSNNITWSLKDKFSKGQMQIGWRLYGYYVKHAKIYEVNESEATIVKEIFERFAQGFTTGEIAKYLNSKGIESPLGGNWSISQIRLMVSNEKYKGDSILQKFYHENGRQYKNNGERDSYYVENSHKGIVSPELWNLANQRLIATSRPSIQGRIQNTYPFSGLIECGCCGKNFNRRVANSGFNCATPYWRCAAGHHDNDKCISTQIKESVLEEKFIEAYNEFALRKGNNDITDKLQKEIDELVKEETECMRLYTNGWISSFDFDGIQKPIVDKIKELTTRIKEIKNKDLKDKDYNQITIFDEDKVYKFLSKVVITRWEVEFHFFNDVIIKKTFTNSSRRKR